MTGWNGPLDDLFGFSLALATAALIVSSGPLKMMFSALLNADVGSTHPRLIISFKEACGSFLMSLYLIESESGSSAGIEDQEEDTIHRTNRIFRNISCCKTNISGENKVFIFNHLVTYLVYFISVIQGSLEKVGGSITGQSAGLYYAQDTSIEKAG